MTGDSIESRLEELLSIGPADAMKRGQALFDQLAGDCAGAIVLFGCGPLGLRTLAGLRRLNIEPLGFADNNPDLWNRTLDGLTVFPPREAVRKFGDAAVFVVTIYNGSGVRQQLRSMGCTMVAPFAYLFWKHPGVFMPHGALDLPHKIFSEADDVRKALPVWADDLSRREYLAQLRWRLQPDVEDMPGPSPRQDTYFPGELVPLSDGEVFVDCGAFDGDTVRDILQRRQEKFGAIIAIEPDPENFGRLKEYISSLAPGVREKVIPVRVATAARRGTLCFDAVGTMASAADPGGAMEVECAPLDEIAAAHNPTYIKMDVEGAEYDTLLGARRIIEQGSAVWAVCLYHRQDDLWRIPLMIASISDRYRLFLRRYAEECWELVCYAIPIERLSSHVKVDQVEIRHNGRPDDKPMNKKGPP